MVYGELPEHLEFTTFANGTVSIHPYTVATDNGWEKTQKQMVVIKACGMDPIVILKEEAIRIGMALLETAGVEVTKVSGE